MRDVMDRNRETFRMFGPDETASNRLGAVLDVTDRTWMAEIIPGDDHLARDGRVMEVLSEHQCQGWLEGYLLTGRHGLFNCYEAFIHIVDSMFNQHAKWLKVTRDLPWRRPIASLNYVLSSLVWRQDHNGFSHQDPGFIDHVVNKKSDVIRVYLPPDANTLLSVGDHCLRSRHYVNVIVAGKQPSPNWLSMDQAILHCTRGIGIWDWASNDQGGEPDVVIASAGDIPTLEALAAVDLIRQHLPELRVRFVNVVDLMRLQDEKEHPHGLSNAEFDSLFTTSRPVVFAYHGYPWLIHRLTYRRTNHANIHVRGYKEEGTTTTPFDMVMLNDLDRFHLVIDVIDRVPGLGPRAGHVRQLMVDRRIEARAYTRLEGEDAPEIANWTWPTSSRDGSQASGGWLSGRRLRRRRVRVRILVVNAGSSSLKLRVLGPADVARRGGRPPAAAGRGRRRCGRRGPRAVRARRRRRPPGGPRRDALHGAGARHATTSSRGSGTSCPSPRSTTRSRSPGSRPSRRRCRACRPWPASTPRSTRRCPPPRRRTRCRPSGGGDGGCAGTASTGSRTPTPRAGWRSCCTASPTRTCGSSRATSARARRSRRCSGGGRWTRRWASRRSRGSSWRPARGASTRASCSGSPSTRACRPTSSRRRSSTGRGSSGSSGTADMRAVLDGAQAGQPEARLALEVYLHRLRGAIASMAASLGGLDGIAFTGGVGERSPVVRAMAADGLGFLGVILDPVANGRAGPGSGDRDVSAAGAPARAFVIPAREDVEIARAVREVVGASG